jgi:N-acetylglucosamine kinase-like BadF-type ATPase
VAIYLGIDGGGSKTTCLVGDESSILGSGSSSGSNIVRVGEPAAREAMAAAIRQACTVAGVSPAQISRACIGAAGAGRPEVRDAIHRAVAAVIAGDLEVVGDTVIALDAAFGSGAGVATIAGTGSIAYGRNAQGETARAGGWGFAISDEGSGHWIGREAVRAALHAHDEGEKPVLLERAMKVLGVTAHEQLVLAANAAPDFSALAPAVFAAADAGDILASQVLHHAGNELARLALVVLRRLFSEREQVPVAMVGGVFRNSPLVRQVFYNTVSSDFARANVLPMVVDPVQGALARARRMA